LIMRDTKGKELARLERERGEALSALLNDLELTGLGVEVGIYRGVHVVELLQRWGGHLMGIDPYIPGSYKGLDTSEKTMMQAFNNTLEYIKEGRFMLSQETSVEAAARFNDKSLDFVYIDAQHDYASVMEDIVAWLPKVKNGGLITGHDFVNWEERDVGVKDAVFDFFRDKGMPLYVMNPHHPMPEWIVKTGFRDVHPTVLRHAELCEIPPQS